MAFVIEEAQEITPQEQTTDTNRFVVERPATWQDIGMAFQTDSELKKLPNKQKIEAMKATAMELGLMEKPKESGWYDIYAATIGNVVPRAVQAIGGLVQSYQEGIGSQAKLGRELAKRRVGQKIAEAGERYIVEPNVEPGSAKGIVYGAGSSVAQIAPWLALGPAGVIGSAMLQTAGQSYREMEKDNPELKPHEKMAGSFVKGMAEGIGEAPPAKALFKLGSKLIKRAIDVTFKDILGEEVTSTLQFLVDKNYINPKLGWKEFKQTVLDTAAITALAGPAMGAIAHPIAKHRGLKQQAIQEQKISNFVNDLLGKIGNKEAIEKDIAKQQADEGTVNIEENDILGLLNQPTNKDIGTTENIPEQQIEQKNIAQEQVSPVENIIKPETVTEPELIDTSTQGEGQFFYHATDAPVTEWKPGQKVNFSDRPMTEAFGEHVYKFEPEIKRPAPDMDAWNKDVAQGTNLYDGIIVEGTDYQGKPTKWGMVKDPSQMKNVEYQGPGNNIEERGSISGMKVYRGGDEPIDFSRGGSRGISVSTSKEIAENFIGEENKIISEAILPSTAKVLKESDIPVELQGSYLEDAKKLSNFPISGSDKVFESLQKKVWNKQQKIIDYAREKGFDAVEFPFEDEIRIIKPNILKESPSPDELARAQQYDEIIPNRSTPPGEIGKSAAMSGIKEDFPVSVLKLDPENMQYKILHGKGGQTGSLEGVTKWNKNLEGIVSVWQNPETGEIVVANGHNRVMKAIELGQDTIPVKFIKADTQQEARAIAAMQNIAEGRGTAFDAAKFFRDSKLSVDDLLQSGIPTKESVVRDGLALSSLNDWIFNSALRGDIPEKRAVLIGSKITNPDMQDALIKLLNKYESNGKKVTNDIISELADDILNAPSKDETQSSLFGDETKTESLALEKAEVAAYIRNNLSKDKKLFGVVGRNANRLESVGNVIKTEESLGISKEAGVILDVFDRNKNYLGPISETLNEAARRIGNGENPGKAKQWAYDKIREDVSEIITGKQKSSPERDKGLFDGITKQEGTEGVTLGFGLGGAQQYIDGLKQTIDNFRSGRQHEKTEKIDTPKEVTYFANRIMPGERSIKSFFAFPETIKQKFPDKFGPIKERTDQKFIERDSKTYEFAQQIQPYIGLPEASKDKVKSFLFAARVRGGKFDTIAEAQKLGFNQSEIDAVQAIKDFANNSLDYLREGLIAKADYYSTTPGKDGLSSQDRYIQKVDEFITDLKDANYVPFSRFGSKWVIGLDAEDKVKSYAMTDSQIEANKLRADFRKQGWKVKYGEVLKSAPEAYENIPIDLMVAINSLNTADPVLAEHMKKMFGRYASGFPEHMLHAALTPGYSVNLDRNLADYIIGITNFVSNKKAEVDYSQMFDAIDQKRDSGVYGYAKRYIDYVTTSKPEAYALRNFMFHYYLGLNVKSALVNLTQTIITTYPVLAAHTKTPEIAYAKAMKQMMEYMASSKKFSAKYPDLMDALNKGISEGSLSAQVYRELSGRARPGMGLTDPGATNISSFMFDKAEKFNRFVSMIAGYNVSIAKGLSHAEAIKQAEQIVKETQFDYTKANRPEIARGRVGSSIMIFRTFMGNYLSLLKKYFMKNGGFPVWSRMLATMFGLAGISGFPLIKDLIKAAEISGYDPKTEMKKALPKNITDTILHGVPYLAGWDISGSLGIQEMTSDIEKGVYPAVGRMITGVAGDIPLRVGRAYNMYRDYDNPQRAAEALAPEAVRNLTVAGRWALEGSRTPANKPIADVDSWDIFMKGLGLQPSTMSRAYEKENARILLTERATKYNKKANWLIASAIFDMTQGKEERGDKKLDKAMAWITKHNEKADLDDMIIPNKKGIQDHLLKMIAPEVADLKRLPRIARPEYMEIQEAFAD